MPLRRLVIRNQGWPSEAAARANPGDDRYLIDDFEHADATEMRTGRKIPIVVEIQVRNANNTRWLAENHLWNFVGTRDMVGTFKNPEEIPDEHLRFYAADLWTGCHNIEASDRVHIGRSSRSWVVDRVETVPYEHTTAWTGYVICKPVSGDRRPVRVAVESLRKKPA
ncbi:hypothetical protein AB0D37_06790 [Streptomyces sp. NPDC048384]|uniref:hypothetical protein n=1 Tax=Streptomyces sp. NPDC048384 TaxID=3155487 RepID=UPI00341B2480